MVATEYLIAVAGICGLAYWFHQALTQINQLTLDFPFF